MCVGQAIGSQQGVQVTVQGPKCSSQHPRLCMAGAQHSSRQSAQTMQSRLPLQNEPPTMRPNLKVAATASAGSNLLRTQ